MQNTHLGKWIVNLRDGVAAVETAIVLPVIVLITFASVEFANSLYLRQSITLGAYEAAMVLAEPQSLLADAEANCNEVLAARNVDDFTVAVTPNPEDEIDPGDLITVTVTASTDAFAMGPTFFMQGRNVVATVTTVRNP